MALLFPEDKNLIRCSSCGAVTFEQIPVYTYKKIKDRQGEGIQRELYCEYLKCSICGTKHNEINDLKKHRILV